MATIDLGYNFKKNIKRYKIAVDPDVGSFLNMLCCVHDKSVNQVMHMLMKLYRNHSVFQNAYVPPDFYEAFYLEEWNNKQKFMEKYVKALCDARKREDVKEIIRAMDTERNKIGRMNEEEEVAKIDKRVRR